MNELDSLPLINDPLSSTSGISVQSSSWSISSGALTLLGAGGGGDRNPDGVGSAIHTIPVWGGAVDLRVQVKVDPSVASSDFPVSAGLGLGPASEPVFSDPEDPWIAHLGLSAGVALCVRKPLSEPTEYSYVEGRYMQQPPSNVGGLPVDADAGYHEIRLLVALGSYYTWCDGNLISQSVTQERGDMHRVHLWGQSNHPSTPHVFWRNLRVKTFPLGITPPEEP